MASFKTHPIFYSAIIVLGLVAAAEGYGIYNRSVVAGKSTAQLQQKRAELRSLEAVRPAPTDASKTAVEADLRRTEAALVTMREELRGRGPAAEALHTAPVPSQPTDVFFNITTFVERMRVKTQEAGIRIRADERFGFATYANEGPARELIPQVFRQRQLAEYLLDALIAAAPDELIALQRERPAGGAAGQPSPPPSRLGGGSQANPDIFEIDPRITARVPGFVNANAFRLTFIGETASLRSLLNKLSSFELPLVVRSVEVEPVASSQQAATPAPQANSLASIFGTASPSTSAEPPKPKPLVEKNPSRFTVTVEMIDLVETPATEAAPNS